MARERVLEAGLAERVEVVEQDYRALRGGFDKLVSIEMIEAVGREYLEEFFGACSRLLKPDGLMTLQAITIRDQFYDRAARERDWLKKYIFPGSCLLSMSAMQHAMKVATDLRLVHMEDLGAHYARTLAEWRERFNANRGRIDGLGFDDRFVRLWNYYMCYCEGAMAERHCSVVQLVAAKPRSMHDPYVERGARVPLRAIAPR